MKKMNVGVVGATGLVGRMMLHVLEERKVPVNHLYLFASERSAGKHITWQNHDYVVEALTETSFAHKDLDVVLFSAGASVSGQYAPLAVGANAIVIDNSSRWRMDPSVPLVVPEVNPEAVIKHQGIIANPNCSTIQSVLPLQVVDACFGLVSVAYTSYQAVSGAGIKGLKDLEQHTAEHFPVRIDQNILPQIDVFMPDGYTKEEHKMIDETRKILDLPQLPVVATCARVPIANTHAVSVVVQTQKPVDLDRFRQALRDKPGIRLAEPFPLAEMADGTDDVWVGRIRQDPQSPYGLLFWCVADNIRKGAATNAVQIAQLLGQEDETV